MRPSRRTERRGGHTDDWLDALMTLVAIVVLVGEVLIISTPFR